MKKRIVVIAPRTDTVINMRGDLIIDMRRKGYDVTVITQEDDFPDFFKKNGVKLRLTKLDKNSFSVFNTLSYYKCLKKIIKEEEPQKVFVYSVKPVVFGSMAAHKAGVSEIYALICGLGMLFCSDSWKIKIAQYIGGIMYKHALKYDRKVIFQNQDDLNEFVDRKYIERKKCELVNGSGVNMKKFMRNKLPKKVSFLMVSRILKEKGVLEFFEAAKIVKEKYPDTTFSYIGSIDKNKNALDFNILQPYIEAGIVEYIPETTEVAKYVAQSSVFVLPSYYREGVPKTLLEATAMGRPILTTNMPGCKETVVEGKNGFFVKVKKAGDLADKMVWMVEHKDKLQEMGDESYKICLEKFTIEKINKQMLEIMEVE